MRNLQKKKKLKAKMRLSTAAMDLAGMEIDYLGFLSRSH